MEERRFEGLVNVDGMAHLRVTPEQQGLLKRMLTLQSPHENKPMVLHLYRANAEGTGISVPRALPGMFDPAEWQCAFNEPTPDWAKLRAKSRITEFREGQQETIHATVEALHQPPFGGIIRAATGAGKTVMGLEIAIRLGLKCLIIVPTTHILNQWIERICDPKKGHTTATRRDVGIVQQNALEVEGKDFVVAMIHTLVKRRYPPEFYRAFGTVIFDEIHVLGAETFSMAAPMFHSKYRLGLSATPRRKDGMANAFLWNIGPIVSQHKGREVIPRVFYMGYFNPATSHNGCVWRGKLNLPRYQNRLARNLERNKFVALQIKTLYDKGRDPLMLTDRLEMIEVVKRILIASGIPASDIGLFTNKVKELNRRILLGTYGSAGIGADIPRLNALVLATPRVDIEQPVGRVMRAEDPIVVDIVDTASDIMKGWARARWKFYRSKTPHIKTVGF